MSTWLDYALPAATVPIRPSRYEPLRECHISEHFAVLVGKAGLRLSGATT